jgi:hypothetical protein
LSLRFALLRGEDYGGRDNNERCSHLGANRKSRDKEGTVAQREIQDLMLAEFPGADAALFEEWKREAILAKKRVRTAWICYGLLAVLLLATGIGVLLPGIPLIVTLYLINRKPWRLAQSLGIAQSYPAALKTPPDPDLVARNQQLIGHSKICPDCAEEIKADARVCRYCKRPFSDDEIGAARSSVAKRAEELSQATAESARRDAAARAQKRTWDASGRAKSSGRSCFVLAGFLALLVLLVVIGTITGPKPQYLPIAIMLTLFTAGTALCVMAGKRKRELARRYTREFEDAVTREGNLIFCPCGRPRTRYFWVHYVLSIVTFPYGLISLFFKLKKCRACGTPYPAMFS